MMRDIMGGGMSEMMWGMGLAQNLARTKTRLRLLAAKPNVLEVKERAALPENDS